MAVETEGVKEFGYGEKESANWASPSSLQLTSSSGTHGQGRFHGLEKSVRKTDRSSRILYTAERNTRKLSFFSRHLGRLRLTDQEAIWGGLVTLFRHFLFETREVFRLVCAE